MVYSYRELLVWQKAKELAGHVYNATESFPRTEIYGLTSQARRAAVSVMSNIAEGQGRLTSGEFLHFLGLARGSLMELEAQLALALDLRFLDSASHTRVGSELYQVLGLLNRLSQSVASGRDSHNDAPALPLCNLSTLPL